MAQFIPNKELYIGLSGCVTALACLWANAMRKKNRNTKTRLRQELLDLIELIRCPPAPASSPMNRSLQDHRRPQESGMQEDYQTCPRNARLNQSGPAGNARRSSNPPVSPSGALRGSPAERYIVHPTDTGIVLSPVRPNQSAAAVQRQQQRIVAQHSPAGKAQCLPQQQRVSSCASGGQQQKRDSPVAGPSGLQQQQKACIPQQKPYSPVAGPSGITHKPRQC